MKIYSGEVREGSRYQTDDYSGLGIRHGRKGKAYNVSGNRGVQLGLSNGKQLMIGTQRPEELAEALSLVMKGKRLHL